MERATEKRSEERKTGRSESIARDDRKLPHFSQRTFHYDPPDEM